MSEASEISFLVADDSATMRRILKKCLAHLGYGDVTEAQDGAQALALAQTRTFGCILVDWNMPKMDGLTFVEKLRALAAYKDTPVVMVTTESTKQDVMMALAHGVSQYIIKPFTPETLKERLDEALGK